MHDILYSAMYWGYGQVFHYILSRKLRNKQCDSNSAPEYAMDMIQKPADRA